VVLAYADLPIASKPRFNRTRQVDQEMKVAYEGNWVIEYGDMRDVFVSPFLQPFANTITHDDWDLGAGCAVGLLLTDWTRLNSTTGLCMGVDAGKW